MDAKLDWWPSPAKLNLFLHITGRLQNGYHQLQSVFQLLDTGDQLAFQPTFEGTIKLLTPIPGVDNGDNLIVKAARLLQQTCGVSQGCNIWLEKNLPMGGGIGGGSSNAATTLVALNHLWQCKLSEDALAELGLQLGADVPIFVRGRSAFAEGVGEKIAPLSLPKSTFLVVFPGVHVSTAEVFTHPHLPRNTPPINMSDYTFETTHNDCQALVCEQQPEVAKLLQWLVEYAPSRMTGTGGCVFAIFDTPEAAQEVRQKLPRNWQGFVATGVDISPLSDKLKLVTGP